MALRSDDIPTLTPLADRYREIRNATIALCDSLEPEDFVVQSMPGASPAKWHLAHTTWFFEQFVLLKKLAGYRVFDDQYHFLFNSYYFTRGQMHARSQRGLLTRPTVATIRSYRDHVDEFMCRLINSGNDSELRFLVELGLNHEQQHQELLLTDIKHAFSLNPIEPVMFESRRETPAQSLLAMSFHAYAGGTYKVGANSGSFCFDNETPEHSVLIHPFELASRLVSNSEYRQFIDAGGYQQCDLWLSDAWAWLQEENVTRPLYWTDDLTREFSLGGMRDMDPSAPVCHISFYEANAYARWANARLPTEAEWEVAAAREPLIGNFIESGNLHPAPATPEGSTSIAQMFGDVWEWTASSYAPYPGFEPISGSLGEYNGKFMCNQMVCRGGSCITPNNHIRASYRNFFYPQDRWQFFGLRLARDA